MIAKRTRNQGQIISDQWSLGTGYEPHIEYANLKFDKPGVPPRAGRLLRWLRYFLRSADWDDARVLSFLKMHHEDFKNCLEWVSKNSVNFDQFDPNDEPENNVYAEMWTSQPEVVFLQKHGLEHARLVLQPGSQEGSTFSGIQLAQEDAKDPLDPICWHLLSLLDVYGEIPVRRCRYPKCDTFYHPETSRKLFCTDSCRALNHAMHNEIKIVEADYAYDESEPEGAGTNVITERQKDRARKAKYMRGYQALPQVKARMRKPRAKRKK